MLRRHRRAFDGFTDRLQSSRNPRERSSLLFGYHVPHGIPVLVDEKLLFEHVHLLGSTGTGKTSIGLQGLSIQLIRRGDGPVVVFDCKGDGSLFHTVASETQRTGRKLKWWTNVAHRSTYVFNAWQQKYLSQLTMQDVLGLITQSLNLVHGADYARAWFGISARILLKRALELAIGRSVLKNPKEGRPASPIQSFLDLDDCIKAVVSNSQEFQAAQHLAFIVESLGEYRQLNLSPRLNPDSAALEHAIHWPDVIREKQVVYFYLAGGADVAGVGQVARLALSSLDFAAMAHVNEAGRVPKIYVLCDEAQMIVAKNVENMLAQARSHGLSCVLANQSMSQFNPDGGADLRELVMSCTAVKWIFAARDPWLVRFISDMSGRVKYYSRAYEQHAKDVMAGCVGPQYACRDEDGNKKVGVREYFGPRLTAERIQDISRDPNQSILAIERTEGLTQVQGYFPVYNDWPISLRQHQRRAAMPWPVASAETISIDSAWPSDGEGTIRPTTHPPLARDEEIVDADALLRSVKKKVEGR